MGPYIFIIHYYWIITHIFTIIVLPRPHYHFFIIHILAMYSSLNSYQWKTPNEVEFLGHFFHSADQRRISRAHVNEIRGLVTLIVRKEVFSGTFPNKIHATPGSAVACHSPSLNATTS